MAQKKTIVIEAKDNTKQAFNKVSKNLDNMDKSVNKTKKSMDGLKGAIKGAIGALTVTAFVGATKSTLDYADALGKTSARLGVTTTALQSLRFAATQSGMTTEALEMSLQRFTRRLAEAGQGTGVLKDTFTKLGMSIKNTDGSMKSAEQMLGEVADKLATIPDQGERVRLAFQMFDSEGVKMVNMLQNGSGALDDMRKKLLSTGAILSEDFIKNSEEANDAIDLLTNQIKTGFGQAIAGLAKPIKATAEALGALIVLAKQYPTITALSGAVGALGLSLATLGGPVTLILSALAGLVAMGVKYHKETQATVDVNKLQKMSLTELGFQYNETATAINSLLSKQAQMREQGGLGGDTGRRLVRETESLKKNLELIKQIIKLKQSEVPIVNQQTDAVKEQVKWKQAQHGLDVLETDQAGYLNDKKAEQYKMVGEAMAQMRTMSQEGSVYHQQTMDQKKAEMQIQEQLMLTSLSMAKQTGDILYEQGVMGFDAMRALAFTEAIINAKVAATKALAQGGIWGTVAAAAIYANAIARAYEIKNMKPPPRREMGGSVSSGQTYLVGERGPEMFTPNTSGNITSNKDLGGTTNITFNIQANDARGFDQLLQARRGLIIGMINKAMKQNAQSGIL